NIELGDFKNDNLNIKHNDNEKNSLFNRPLLKHQFSRLYVTTNKDKIHDENAFTDSSDNEKLIIQKITKQITLDESRDSESSSTLQEYYSNNSDNSDSPFAKPSKKYTVKIDKYLSKSNLLRPKQ